MIDNSSYYGDSLQIILEKTYTDLAIDYCNAVILHSSMKIFEKYANILKRQHQKTNALD